MDQIKQSSSKQHFWPDFDVFLQIIQFSAAESQWQSKWM